MRCLSGDEMNFVAGGYSDGESDSDIIRVVITPTPEDSPEGPVIVCPPGEPETPEEPFDPWPPEDPVEPQPPAEPGGPGESGGEGSKDPLDKLKANETLKFEVKNSNGIVTSIVGTANNFVVTTTNSKTGAQTVTTVIQDSDWKIELSIDLLKNIFKGLSIETVGTKVAGFTVTTTRTN